MDTIKANAKALEQVASHYERLKQEMAKVIVNQEDTIEQLVIALFCDGHALLEGVPGLAKTLMVRTLARCFSLKFSRIQFTPDLMPSDVTGTELFMEGKGFEVRVGPVFANIVLADEINRAPPKTQAALLEAMQERQVTIAGKTYRLERPFFVLATQNPIEQEGTYPLPEAQLDRFMFLIKVDYLSEEDEVEMVMKTISPDYELVPEPFLSSAEIIQIQQLIRQVPVPEPLVVYAVGVVRRTRPNNKSAPEKVKRLVEWGAGPRASQFLVVAATCHALLKGRIIPTKEDVQAVAHCVLRHRIILNYRAEAENITPDDIVEEVL